MLDVLIFGGLVSMGLGFALYRYGWWKRTKRSTTSFRCVHHTTVTGEPISFLLAPQEGGEAVPTDGETHDEDGIFGVQPLETMREPESKM